MTNELRELIDAYHSKAFELIPQLFKALELTLPISKTDWVRLDVPQRGKVGDSLQYFKHGYGVAIKFDGGEIDIDFGDKGEYNGFDGWRLFRFAEESNFRTPYKDHREVEADIIDAVQNGQLRDSGYSLYFLNND